MRRFGVIALAVLGLLCAGRAEAVPLADVLDPGFSLEVNGLEFSDFVLGTALGVDVSEYEVVFFGSGDEAGLRLIGPAVATAGQLSFVELAYDVVATLTGGAITQATLFANLSAIGTGSVAAVDEALRRLSDLAPVGALSAVDIGDAGVPFLGESLPLAGGPAGLRVDTSITALSAPTGAALVTFVEQRFARVPEPGALLMLGSGALGLAAFGSRRA